MSFSGHFNACKPFLLSFVRKLSIWNVKLQKGQLLNFELKEKELDVMRRPKVKLMFQSVLPLQYDEVQFTMDTDNCDFCVGCQFVHNQPYEATKSVRYWTRSVTSAKCIYVTTPRNCLFIIQAVLPHRSYLQGTRLVIGTNQNSVKWVLKMSDNPGGLAWRSLWLPEFHFENVFQAGVNSQAAHGLSKLRTMARGRLIWMERRPCATSRTFRWRATKHLSCTFARNGTLRATW